MVKFPQEYTTHVYVRAMPMEGSAMLNMRQLLECVHWKAPRGYNAREYGSAREGGTGHAYGKITYVECAAASGICTDDYRKSPRWSRFRGCREGFRDVIYDPWTGEYANGATSHADGCLRIGLYGSCLWTCEESAVAGAPDLHGLN